MPRRTLALAALLILLSGATIAVAAISENTGVAYGGTSSLTGPDGVCKKITNNSATGKQVYVPGSTAAEWQSFVASPPAGVALSSCVTSGTFNPKVDYAAPADAREIAAADMNGDGTMDIVTANGTSKSVSIFMNTGSGTFTRADYAVRGTYGIVGIEVADLNGDARPDVGTISAYGGAVFLNNGNGTLGAETDYSPGGTIQNIGFADLNNDGKPDMVVLNDSGSSGHANVYLNNGSGAFTLNGSYTTAVGPSEVDFADVDGNGSLDMAIACYFNKIVSVLKNNGNGTFATKVDNSLGINDSNIAMGDFDNSGRPDYVVSGYAAAGTIAVLFNNGSGAFGSRANYSTGSYSRGVASRDLTNDGAPDIMVVNWNSSTVSVFLNLGSGTFATKTDYSTGTNPWAVTSADFNSDGIADMATVNRSGSISVFTGK